MTRAEEMKISDSILSTSKMYEFKRRGMRKINKSS